LSSGENFTVWADSQAEADAVLSRAEFWREQIAREWLGGSLPSGIARTSLNVRISSQDSAHAWLTDEASDGGHLIWIRTTRGKLDSALAHEIAHVVLATSAPDLPAFVQEGIAGQYDDGERRALRQATLEGFVRTGRWPRLIDVLEAQGIAPADRQSYAVAVSFTEFLLRHEPNSSREELLIRASGQARESEPGPRARVLEFAIAGRRTGSWDAAARRHYGVSGIEALAAAWRAWTADSLSAPAARVESGRRGRVEIAHSRQIKPAWRK
jgi:hypothetical protein